MEIPVYLIAGFLDAGKTDFINSTLEDGFAREDKTLLVCCEEGELEYERNALDNVTVVTVEDEEELSKDLMKAWEKQYRPKQVMVEYNGMWSLEGFWRSLPDNWVLYQIMTIVKADTFDVYAKNMGQMMMEKITNADLIIFNRCTPELRDSLRRRNLRMVNRRAEIYLENTDGTSDNYLTGEESPFDLTPEVVEIPDDDFGVWYVDVMDHPERYAGKKLHMKLVMFRSKKWGGVPCPGRFAMVCCANDIQFLGLLAQGEALAPYKDRQWIDATVRMEIAQHPAYKGKGPVMNVLEARPSQGANPEVVSF